MSDTEARDYGARAHKIGEEPLSERASQYAGASPYTAMAIDKALDALVDALDEETRLMAIHKTNPNHPALVNAQAAHAQARKKYFAIADRTTYVRLGSQRHQSAM